MKFIFLANVSMNTDSLFYQDSFEAVSNITAPKVDLTKGKQTKDLCILNGSQKPGAIKLLKIVAIKNNNKKKR